MEIIREMIKIVIVFTGIEKIGLKDREVNPISENRFEMK